MNHLEIKHLRMIKTISQMGNMTRAAHHLCVTQSALSQQLKDIEYKLGTSLFVRTKKKMILTAPGKTVLKTAETLIDIVEDTELEIARMAMGEEGELKVGTQCIFCYKWLPRVMKAFQKRFAGIQFIIGNSEDLVEELDSGKFDFVITAAVLNDDGFVHIPLFQDRMVCIMPNDHPLSVKPFVDFKDLGNETLIIHSRQARQKYDELGFGPAGVTPKKYMTVNQPQAIIEMVASGFGIAFFPRWAIQSAIEDQTITVRTLTRTGGPVQWHAVHLKHLELTAFQKEFIHMVSRLNLSKID